MRKQGLPVTIAARAANRHCVVRRIQRFNRRALQTDLLAGNGVCDGFVTLEAPLAAANKTSFKVYEVGRRLVLAVCVMDRRDFAVHGSEAKGDSIEVIIDPYHDHIGYSHFVLRAGSPPSARHHMPYEANRRTSFAPLRLARFEWVHEPASPDEPDWVFAWFETDQVFRAGAVCGFNVGRGHAATNEVGSWNPSTHMPFGEATSLGHLYRRAPASVLRNVEVRRQGDTLLLSGEWTSGKSRSLALRDPLGQRVSLRTGAKRGGSWSARASLRNGVGGHYRLIPDAGRGVTCEPDWMSFNLPSRKRSSFVVGMTYDIPDDFDGAWLPYTPRSLAAELDLFASCGIRRIHWIDYAPDSAVWFLPGIWKQRTKILQSFRNCGDLLPLAARLAHERGMEFIAIYKPFDLAFNAFQLSPAQAARTPHKLLELENRWIPAPPDLAAHPECAMQRHPGWRAQGDRPVRLRFYSREPIPRLRPSDVRLFESADNRRYTPYRRGFTLKQGMVRRAHQELTPAGNVPVDGSERNGFLELSGLRPAKPYLAVDISRKGFRLAHRGHALAEAWDARGRPAPLTLATGGNRAEGFTFWKKFRTWANRSPALTDEYVWAGGAQGMTFQQRPDMRALLEPAFEESRRIWLAGVRRTLEAGADGVSIRTISHHNVAMDYMTFAYADPVRRAFQARYGRPVTPSFEDCARARRLRGDFYTDFLREASRLARGLGKKFIAHLECGVEIPPEVDQPMQFNMDWERWITEGILDEVILKWCAPENPFIMDRILPLARRLNIPVHIVEANASLVKTVRSAERCRRMLADARATGFAGQHFYEAAYYKRRNRADKPFMLANTRDAIREAVGDLGLYT